MASFAGPIDSAVVSSPAGHVDALGNLAITEASAQNRDYIEVGLQRDYDATSIPALIVEGDDLVLVSGVRDTSPTSGAYSSQSVTYDLDEDAPAVLCATGTQVHKGTWKVGVRLYASSTNTYASLTWVRLVWRTASGPWTEESWRAVPTMAQWHELTLATLDIEEVSGQHSWEGRIEAYQDEATTATQVTLEIDFVDFMALPSAQISARAPVGSSVLVREPFNQSAGNLDTKTIGGGASIVSGPNSPDTAADDAGVGTVAWTNATNVLASDNSRATVTPGVGGISHYLKVTDFDFALPASATVLGIVAEIERSATESSDISDYRVRIVKGGTIGSTERAKTSLYWPTTDAYASYGSASDLWGDTWTDTDINATTFGVAIAVTSDDSDAVAQVDHVRLTVYYQTSTGAAWTTTGATTDFAVSGSGTVTRSVATDTGGSSYNDGRRATAGTVDYGACLVGVDLKRPDGIGAGWFGLRFRQVDTSNYASAVIIAGGDLRLQVTVAATTTSFGLVSNEQLRIGSAGKIPDFSRLEVAVDLSGFCWVYWRGRLVAIGYHSSLASGGALASGEVGILDLCSSSGSTRTFDNFTVSGLEETDHALWQNLTASLTHEQYLRDDSSGSVQGEEVIDGDYMFFPPATRAARASRLIVKARRGDITAGAPSQGLTDNLTITAMATPRVVVLK